MKKFLIAVSVIALIFAAFGAGKIAGQYHALTGSELWIAEYAAPEDGNGDLIINIDLDGNTY